jgi:hypothetical protein
MDVIQCRVRNVLAAIGLHGVPNPGRNERTTLCFNASAICARYPRYPQGRVRVSCLVRLGFGDSMMTSRTRAVRREIGRKFKNLIFEKVHLTRKGRKAVSR